MADTKVDFCYAPGDEGAEFCGDPRSRHCSVLGDAITHEHLVKCMRDDHLIHHAFQTAEPVESETQLLPCPLCAVDSPQLNNNERRNWVIFCRGCGIELEESNREGDTSLIARWNARVVPSSEVEVDAATLVREKAEEYRLQAERWQQQADNEQNRIAIRNAAYADRDACLNKMAALTTFAVELESVDKNSGTHEFQRTYGIPGSENTCRWRTEASNWQPCRLPRDASVHADKNPGEAKKPLPTEYICIDPEAVKDDLHLKLCLHCQEKNSTVTPPLAIDTNANCPACHQPPLIRQSGRVLRCDNTQCMLYGLHFSSHLWNKRHPSSEYQRGLAELLDRVAVLPQPHGDCASDNCSACAEVQSASDSARAIRSRISEPKPVTEDRIKELEDALGGMVAAFDGEGYGDKSIVETTRQCALSVAIQTLGWERSKGDKKSS